MSVWFGRLNNNWLCLFGWWYFHVFGWQLNIFHCQMECSNTFPSRLKMSSYLLRFAISIDMLTNTNKRPGLCDLTNVEVDGNNDTGKCLKVGSIDSFSLRPKLKETGEHTCAHVPELEDMNKKICVHTQNIHPALELAMYHPDSNASSSISWTQLQHL